MNQELKTPDRRKSHYTPAEAARLLGLDAAYRPRGPDPNRSPSDEHLAKLVRPLIKDGSLKACQVGRRYLIPAGAIQDYLKNADTRQAAPAGPGADYPGAATAAGAPLGLSHEVASLRAKVDMQAAQMEVIIAALTAIMTALTAAPGSFMTPTPSPSVPDDEKDV